MSRCSEEENELAFHETHTSTVSHPNQRENDECECCAEEKEDLTVEDQVRKRAVSVVETAELPPRHHSNQPLMEQRAVESEELGCLPTHKQVAKETQVEKLVVE